MTPINYKLQLDVCTCTPPQPTAQAPPSSKTPNRRIPCLVNHPMMVGPGSYATDKVVSLLHNPSWKIGTDKRDHTLKSETPGPGSYQPKSYIVESHPITMKARSKDHKQDQKPGPGSYNPHFEKLMKQEPGYKLGSVKKMSMVEHNAYVPGPGAYDTLTQLTKLGTGVKFGSQKRLSFDLSRNVPGPGSYYDEKQVKLLNAHPKYSFGHSERAQLTNSKSPGRKDFSKAAGQYDTKGEIEAHSIKKKGYSMSHLKRDTMGVHSANPGPGAYDLINQSHKSLKRTPSYSIGHSAKGSFVTNNNPGPLNYVVKDDLIQKHSNIVIGKSKRETIDIAHKAVIPGPGAYGNKDITGHEGPKYSMSFTKANSKPSTVPGPGAYNPHEVQPSDPRPVIGREKRSDNKSTDALGPGQYNPYSEDTKGKGFTIGNEKRDHQREALTPGPGQYDVQTTISNVPRYSGSASRT